MNFVVVIVNDIRVDRPLKAVLKMSPEPRRRWRIEIYESLGKSLGFLCVC